MGFLESWSALPKSIRIVTGAVIFGAAYLGDKYTAILVEDDKKKTSISPDRNTNTNTNNTS